MAVSLVHWMDLNAISFSYDRNGGSGIMTNMRALYKFVQMHYLINLLLYGTSCTGPYGQGDSLRSRSITLLSLISWLLF